MSVFMDLLGTVVDYFRIGKTGPRLKNTGTGLAVRDAGDTVDVPVTVSQANVSGNQVVINSDAAGVGADWRVTLVRPATGMSAHVTLTLPIDDGFPGQVMATDGNGNLSWADGGVGGGALAGPAGGDLTGTYPNPQTTGWTGSAP